MNSPAEAEPTDHELLQAHVDGDPDAFAILFRATATGSGPWPCAPWATPTTPPTDCRTA